MPQAPIGVQQGFGLGFGNTCFVEQLLPDRWKIFANSGPDEWPRSPGDQVPGAKMRLRFSIIPPDANGFRLRCEVVGVQGGAVNNVTMPQGPFGPVFLSPATYGIPFDYIDVVE